MAEASGIDILVDAIITVASGHPDVHFVLAGSGSLREAVMARAAAAQLGNRCRFTGDLGTDACRDYLAAADCVVIPAHEAARDGFAETALAAGKPVLTTHQAQLPAVCHGVNGLVAYDNPNSLVWGLRELLSMRAEQRLFFEPSRRVA
jgi:glycosyltransferase involved in cell wall biosynthesis